MKPIPVAFWREEKYWVARALPVNVSSFGETLDEARDMIREALELYLEDEAEPPLITEAVLEEVVV